MTILEKYPENIPWDLSVNEDKIKYVNWILTKDENAYTFTRSHINGKYVYIKKNEYLKTDPYANSKTVCIYDKMTPKSIR